MSFGYLIAPSQPCELLTKSRGETFSLIMDKMDLWIYFRFCEGNIYTIRKNETESCLTERGGKWLKHIYEFNRGSFIFSYVLLKKRESEENFAEIVLKSIKNNKILTVKVRSGLHFDLRNIYRIEMYSGLN
ncbi:TPA: hypothetical protein WHF15_000680, partial [Neisseria meningitidis]